MTAAGRLPVIAVVVMGYRDLVRVMRTLRSTVIIALLLVLAVRVAELTILAQLKQVPVLGVVVSLAVGAVRGFLLTPFLIAVHRFVILDEITRGYVLDVHDPRFFQFFVWSLALTVFAIGALILMALLALVAALSVTIGVLVEIAVIAFAMIVMLRLTILFPAIAVDAPGANAPNAFADTKGHVLAIFLIFFVAFLPPTGIYLAISVLFGTIGDPSSLIATIVTTALSALTLPLFVALASRIFQTLADRLLSPAPV